MTSALVSQERMTTEAFLAWYEQQPPGKRYELLDGVVFPREMAAERATHARIKLRIARLFEDEIASRSLPCECFTDGMAVSIDEGNSYEPDALVRCGPRLPGDAIVIADPIIVVEVASPSTYRVDALAKLTRYFENPHIVHYLIVLSQERTIIHHRRGTPISMATYKTGVLTLDPPGIILPIADVFANA